MTFLNMQTGHCIMPIIRAMLAFAVLAFAIAPAYAKDHNNGRGNGNNGRGNGGYNNGYRGNGNGYGYQGRPRHYHPPYRYSRPPPPRYHRYVPPPIYYPQIQSPGINLVFPIDIR